jgi:hypothetical protein
LTADRKKKVDIKPAQVYLQASAQRGMTVLRKKIEPAAARRA